MIEVLYFSDKEVRRKLFERVASSKGLLVASQVHHGPEMTPVAKREPFGPLEHELGSLLTQVVLADDGKPEGMWRDPLGDLADALFPDDRANAFAAAHGYVLFVDGEVDSVLKKHADGEADRWFLQELLASISRDIRRPDPADRPSEERSRRPTESAFEDPAIRGSATAPRASSTPAKVLLDPWAVLGIARGTDYDQARRLFRALVAQYHPDKVAHLAPEFRELADKRTREILQAWQRVKREIGK